MFAPRGQDGEDGGGRANRLSSQKGLRRRESARVVMWARGSSERRSSIASGGLISEQAKGQKCCVGGDGVGGGERYRSKRQLSPLPDRQFNRWGLPCAGIASTGETKVLAGHLHDPLLLAPLPRREDGREVGGRRITQSPAINQSISSRAPWRAARGDYFPLPPFPLQLTQPPLGG